MAEDNVEIVRRAHELLRESYESGGATDGLLDLFAPNVRVEACRLLGQVGTKDSLSTLQGLAARKGDTEVARQAADTVRAIRNRHPDEAELTRLQREALDS